jgi:hypothetical protein
MAPFTLAVILKATAQTADRKGQLRTATFDGQTEFTLGEVSGIVAMIYPGLDFEWSTNGAQISGVHASY